MAAWEKRQSIAEASGETIKPTELKPPTKPTLGDDVWFCPHLRWKKATLPDVSKEDVARNYAQYTLPLLEEGFDSVDYVWTEKTAANAHLRDFVMKRKVTSVVSDLKPGESFVSDLKAWKLLKRR